jgi:hypothetical protein
MITHIHEQRSPEWHAARAGVITASMFSTARYRTKKGEWSADARKYAFCLAIERLGGSPLDDGMETAAMRRGTELEPAARKRLSQILGKPIEIPGFITTDDKRFGASADGFIDDDGGCEIKCLVDAGRIHSVLIENDLSDFMDQIQGCMWVTDRSWWDFCVYLPQLQAAKRDIYRKRVFRDNAYILQMVTDLHEFDKYVEHQMAGLRNHLPVYSDEPF